MNSLLSRADRPGWQRPLVEAGAKLAADAEVAYHLVGTLQLSGGRLLLSVPNALVRGVFQALGEHGVELPTTDGGLNAAIEVMTPDEVTVAGGGDAIVERGKQYNYTLGRLLTVEPDWPDVTRLWFIRVHSRDLQLLRRSYGLSSLPSDADFKICVAVRRRGVLGRNERAVARED